MYLFYHTSKTKAQSVSAGHQKHQHHAMIFIVSQLQDDTEDGDLRPGQPLPQAEARPPHQRGVHTARRPHRAHQHRHHRGSLQVSRYLQYLPDYLQYLLQYLPDYLQYLLQYLPYYLQYLPQYLLYLQGGGGGADQAALQHLQIRL